MTTELILEDDADDEYETEAQAITRIRTLRGDVVATIPVIDDIGEIITQYGAFNQAEYFEPLFASGELHGSLRHMLDNPLHVSNNIRSAVRFADLRNQERANADQMGLYGPVVVRMRTIVEQPWREVSYDDVDQARGRR